MCSMASSSLSTSDSVLNYPNDIRHDQLSISSDGCNDETMPVIADVKSIDLLKSKKPSKWGRTSLVIYGPISVRKRHTTAPTLLTGRRSKDHVIEGEDAIKREKRRTKNRESARNLKILRDNIEHELKKQVNKLESEEHNLLIKVNNLRRYKQYLEEQCRQTHPIYEIITRTASAVLSELKRQQTSLNVHSQKNYIEPKDEPRPPSPPWQLLFHI